MLMSISGELRGVDDSTPVRGNDCYSTADMGERDTDNDELEIGARSWQQRRQIRGLRITDTDRR